MRAVLTPPLGPVHGTFFRLMVLIVALWEEVIL
jgi:hypothetical protein